MLSPAVSAASACSTHGYSPGGKPLGAGCSADLRPRLTRKETPPLPVPASTKNGGISADPERHSMR